MKVGEETGGDDCRNESYKIGISESQKISWEIKARFWS